MAWLEYVGRESYENSINGSSLQLRTWKLTFKWKTPFNFKIFKLQNLAYIHVIGFEGPNLI